MSRILLVEDNDSIILGLEYLFKEEKFEFDFAKLKKDAIEKIEKENFDFVLMDLMFANILRMILIICRLFCCRLM